MLASRCAGWAVTDVLCHQLLDARPALLAIEAALHCPDLHRRAASRPGTGARLARVVRRTLDGLLAATMPGTGTTSATP